MRFSTLFLVSCVFSSGVLGFPRGNVKKHAEIISRSTEIELPVQDSIAEQIPSDKRSLRKRCVARNSTTPSLASTSTVKTAPSVVNVAPAPTVQAPSSSVKASAPASPSKEPSSSPAPPPPSPKPSTTAHHSSSPAPKPSPSPKPSSSAPPPPPKHTSSPLPPSSNPLLGGILSGAPVTGGDFTFYETGLGACGITNTDSDAIAAAGWELFDNFPGATGNPNNNPICGKKVKLTYQGKSTIVAITDRCTGCSARALDLSPDSFQQLAPLSVGRLTGGTWIWCDDGGC